MEEGVNRRRDINTRLGEITKEIAAERVLFNASKSRLQALRSELTALQTERAELSESRAKDDDTESAP